MLRVLGQPDTTGVRDDRDAEFPCHQQNGEDFVDATDATGVWLEDGQGSGLKELFEDDAVLAHFARGDADRAVGGIREGFADCGVAEDVVRGGGFFDEPGFVFGQFAHPGNCFGDGPDLYH